MYKPDLVIVLEVLSSCAGLVLSILLLVLARRSARRWPGAGLLAICSLIWNTGSLAALVQMLLGVPTTAWTYSVALCLQVVGGTLFPISFITAWSFPAPTEPRQRAWARWLFRVAIVNAVTVNLVVVAGAFFGIMPYLARLVCPSTEAILLTIAAFILVRGRIKTTADRIYLTFTMLGVWISAIGMIALEFWTPSGVPFQILCLIVSESPFLIIVGTLFFFARFRSADILIHSSRRVIVSLALAMLCYVAISICDTVATGSFVSSRVGHAVLITLMLFGLQMSFRWIDAVVERASERWILRERDYRTALRQLWDQLGVIETESEIVAAIERFLPPFLEVAAVRVVDCHHHRSFTTQPWEVTPDDPCRFAIPGLEAELLVPVRLRGEIPYVMAIATGSNCGRILLSKDLHFLSEVAGQISTRLESLAGERERAERQSREASLKHLAVVAELKALRAQINPHFLFNSLNTIADLIVSDPAKAETMTVLLANVFRHVLLHSDGHPTSIADEVAFLRTYLRIEEVRFGDRLQVSLDIETSVAQNRIPSLLLQPIVENAIKHGLAPKIGQGRLRIAAHAQGEFTRLEVEDDGVGLGDLRSGGVGLKNVAERLRMLYDGRARLTCENAALAGTLVTILIPNPQQP